MIMRSRGRSFLLLLVLVVLTLGAAATAYALRYSAIAPLDRSTPPSFAADAIATGETLAAAGNCAVCHSAPGGMPLAGGRPLATPFGTIHSTNITPDSETGIGLWTGAAFIRALREGVDRNGRYLYPAFPYDHFAKTTEEDARALYAYFMTRRAVRAPAAQNNLRFPFNFRALVAGWNFLYLDRAPFRPDPARSLEFNRGAYLVDGLGHCGACHTPRNALGAERGDAKFAGGEAEGWRAPALNGASPATVPWTVDAMVNFLVDGWDAQHGVAGGPMTDVVNQLARLPESDVYAISTYIVTLAGRNNAASAAQPAAAKARQREFDPAAAPPDSTPPDSGPADPAQQRAATLFARECASCHKNGGQTAPLGLMSAVTAPDPTNLMRAVREGIRAPAGAPDHSMPKFVALSTDDLAALADYIRARFTDQPAWTNTKERAAQIR